MGSEVMLYEQFSEADQLDLSAEALAQAGATIRKNLPACRDERGAGTEVLGYEE